MTDKQIIIDGVDVSGCAGYYFSPTKFHSCQDIQQVNNLGYEQDTLCEQNPNCYYKQLKRKEQECERLKEEVSLLKESNSKLQQIEDVNSLEKCYLQQLDQLKAENEKLKKQVCGLRPELKSIIDKTCCKYNIEAKYYHEKIVEIINNLDELKQTLTEIKNIAKEKAKVNDWLALEILQKISECEGNNDMENN